tara:strand:- start:229 stop:342 length:114 start_codon:yes stop_codon:yes gene_type:complete
MVGEAVTLLGIILLMLIGYEALTVFFPELFKMDNEEE